LFDEIKFKQQEQRRRLMAHLAQTKGGQPILILKEGTSRSRGKEAQRNNIMAAKIIAEAIRSTLGPRGMDKMIVV